MQRGDTSVNYLLLLLVILIGVAGGNLIADWVTAQINAYRTEKTPIQPKSGRAGTTRGQEPSGTKIPFAGDLIRGQQEQARDQRRRDRDGVRLSPTCEEWRRMNAQLNSETTGAEMKRHCGIYERYVQDGILPGKK